MTDAHDERRFFDEGNGELASVYETELKALSGRSGELTFDNGGDPP